MRNRLFGAALAAMLLAGTATAGTMPGAAVKVEIEGGHGSGVNIGGGVIITAAHVVSSVTDGTVKIKTDQGMIGPAVVKWVNRFADVAVLAVSAKAPIGVAKLSCKDPSVGDVIYADGNPTNMEFIRTWGHIAGAKRKSPPFNEVMITDLTVAEGMSGGPVYNAAGEVVGIAVAVSLQPLGSGKKAYAVPTGLSVMVPGSTICKLLDRTS